MNSDRNIFPERKQLSQVWPDPPLNIVLVEPRIPPNTGAIARLCAATGTVLHLVEPLGFSLTSHRLKRAGLDYWESVEIVRHRCLREFLDSASDRRIFLFSTKAEQKYTAAEYTPGDMLVFGSETQGLPTDLLLERRDDVYGLPIRLDHVRSLNLATSAAIVLYEALRQSDI